MNKRVKIAICAIVPAIVLLLFLQYFWLDKTFHAEQKRIKTQASALLNDVLDLQLKNSAMERYDILNEKGVSVEGEQWGGNYEEKMVVVYLAYPEPVKIMRQCDTHEEWYEYTKDIHCRYHITGIDMLRLDSAYKTALKKHDIMLPFTLVKIDSAHCIVEQVSTDIDLGRYRLSADTIPLGITGEEFLVVRFDSSYFGMFRQMRSIVFTSLGVVALLAVILIYLVQTIFYQKKIAKVREELVQSIVHDLRNPITYTKKVLNRIETEEVQQKRIEAAKRKCEQVLLMIEKMLVTSSGRKRLDISPQLTSIAEYVCGIVGQYNMDLDLPVVQFKSVGEPRTANIDLLHFRNAVINLIDNAIKYSGEKLDVLVTCYEENSYICVSVEDHGVGIPKEFMRFLFKKNFRVPQQKSMSKSGFGLGLYYVNIVAKAHDGRVRVESRYKEGSTFTIMVPIAKN